MSQRQMSSLQDMTKTFIWGTERSHVSEIQELFGIVGIVYHRVITESGEEKPVLFSMAKEQEGQRKGQNKWHQETRK